MKKLKAALEIFRQDIRGNSQLNQRATLFYIARTALISLYISIKYGAENKKAGMICTSSRRTTLLKGKKACIYNITK